MSGMNPNLNFLPIPIAYVGEAHGSNAAGGVVGNLSINVPGGVQNDDVLFAFVHKAQDSVHTLTAPAGWSSLMVRNDAEINCSIWYKVASSEPASYTWTVSGTGIWGCCQFAFRNLDKFNPVYNGDILSYTGDAPTAVSSQPVLVRKAGSVCITMAASASTTTTEITSSINVGTEIVDHGNDGGVSSRNAAVFYSPPLNIADTSVTSYSVNKDTGTASRRTIMDLTIDPASFSTPVVVNTQAMNRAHNW